MSNELNVIEFSTSEFESILDVAKGRWANNRASNNPVGRSPVDGTLPYKDDIVGAIGEFAVAKYLGITDNKFVYDQEEFREVKNKINDIGKYEVRSTDYHSGGLAIYPKDVNKLPDTKYILCIVQFNIHTKKAVARLMGYITPREAAQDVKSLKSYFKFGYLVSQKDLKPLKSL
jgi:hypothetical protein